MDKRCSKCKTYKSRDNFTKCSSRKDGLNHICKTCQRAYVKDHYNKNKQYYLDKARKRNVALLEEVVRRVKELKSKPCSDCKVSYPPYVMDFDHVQGEKVDAVAMMVRKALPWSRIEAEIAKCELVCANCHRIRTHVRKGKSLEVM